MGAVAILLGELWLRELTANRIGQLSEPETKNALAAIGLPLPNLDKRGEGKSEELIEELQIDFCQLLIGPQGHISPVESVWASEQFQSKTVDQMRAFFELLPGYQPTANFHDHIGVQLDFAGHLLTASANSAANDEQANDEQLDELIAIYVEQRMAWTKPMLEKVKRQAQTEFYQQLADVTLNFVELFKPLTKAAK